MHKILVIRLYFPFDALHVSDSVSPSSGATLRTRTTQTTFQFNILSQILSTFQTYKAIFCMYSLDFRDNILSVLKLLYILALTYLLHGAESFLRS